MREAPSGDRNTVTPNLAGLDTQRALAVLLPLGLRQGPGFDLRALADITKLLKKLFTAEIEHAIKLGGNVV